MRGVVWMECTYTIGGINDLGGEVTESKMRGDLRDGARKFMPVRVRLERRGRVDCVHQLLVDVS